MRTRSAGKRRPTQPYVGRSRLTKADLARIECEFQRLQERSRSIELWDQRLFCVAMILMLVSVPLVAAWLLSLVQGGLSPNNIPVLMGGGTWCGSTVFACRLLSRRLKDDREFDAGVTYAKQLFIYSGEVFPVVRREFPPGVGGRRRRNFRICSKQLGTLRQIVSQRASKLVAQENTKSSHSVPASGQARRRSWARTAGTLAGVPLPVGHRSWLTCGWEDGQTTANGGSR
jgi:hypothetical protein